MFFVTRSTFKMIVAVVVHSGLSTRHENCGEDYFKRIVEYAISALITVDNKKCIHHASVGWPGSILDHHI